jgi:hypothetical protein
MNYIPRLMLIPLLFVFTSCGSAKNEENDEATEEQEEAIEGDLIDEDLGEGETMDAETLVADEEGVGSRKTYTLKWKGVSYDEYGISYAFEDKKGEEVYFFHLNIPGFTDNENDYYTSTPVEDRIFPVLEIKESVKEKWFEVLVEIQNMENEAEPSETNEVPVIIGIKPL